MDTSVRRRSDNSITADTSNHGISKSVVHRNLERTYKIPDFQHPYTKHLLHPMTAQYNDEVNNFLASHGVDKQLGPERWRSLVSDKICELLGFVFFGTEPRDFLWLCEFLGVTFAIDNMVDEGEWTNSPDKCCATILGMTLSLLWYNSDEESLLERAKQLNDGFTSGESRALVKAFHEDLVHARNKTKNLRDIMMPPLASAFRGLWIEYCEAVPAEFLARQAHAIQDYFVGFVWEINNRTTGYQIGNMEDYVEIRRLTVGLLPFIIYSDLITARSLKSLPIPNSLFYGPQMQSLLLAISDVIGWHNDILSFYKEVIRVGDAHNLVKVICEERRCASYTEAAEIALQLLHDRIADMELAYKQLKAVASVEYHPAIDSYMSVCRDWISGTHQWHLISPRYNVARTSM